MSECNSIENTDLTYYQRNRDVILDNVKDYYKNNMFLSCHVRVSE